MPGWQRDSGEPRRSRLSGLWLPVTATTYLTVNAVTFAVDSLTHALFASILFTLIGHPELVPFAALGAVCPDVDILFQRFSDRDPRLYIFTHGGITHSIAGALTTSAGAALLGLTSRDRARLRRHRPAGLSRGCGRRTHSHHAGFSRIPGHPAALSGDRQKVHARHRRRAYVIPADRQPGLYRISC